MNLRHRMNVYFNLFLVFLTTLRRHGPRIAIRRSSNFIKSRRINAFFSPIPNANSAPKQSKSRKHNATPPPQLLIVTHVWNTSGVPILAEHLSIYFKNKGFSTGIWSVESPKIKKSKLVGFGDSTELVASFSTLPKIIFLNTTCVPASFIDFCCEQLIFHRIDQLILYSHEDIVILPKMTIQLLDVASSTNCHIFAGSEKTAIKLQSYFKNKKVLAVPYQIHDTSRLKTIMKMPKLANYSSLDIVLVGSTEDNRKGHVQAAKTIYWARFFCRVIARRQTENVNREINFTAVGAQLFPSIDAISSEVIEILNRKLTILPILDSRGYLETLEKQNAVICVSQYETLPLYVSEAMARGCLVLRNSSGGLAEQLREGYNGIKLANHPIFDGYKIYKLSRMNETKLMEMGEQSMQRFKEIHTSPWDLSFGFLLKNE